MKPECDIAIIGGGVMGLSVAYQLAARGTTDLVVLERGYMAEGASGRNGGGVRMQWSTESNIRLMQESIDLMRHFAQEIGVNIWLRQGGYLFLGKSEAERAQMEANVQLQNRCGVRTRMLSPEEARAIVPDLKLDGFVCASYNPADGTVFPWPFLWGYAQQAMARGVEVRLHTGVTAIERKRDGFSITTTRGALACKRIINAAGAWSPEVARLVGLELPNRPHRHEILSTEPLKPFLDPMVSLLSSGLYFSQSMRGEIVTGISHDDTDDGTVKLGSRLSFLQKIARELTALMPRLREIKVLRQWAGPYDVTPDWQPIVGEAAPGFYLCCGFGGYGFMMAPVVGKRYAEWLTGGPKDPLFERFTLERFARGELVPESMILG